MEFTTSVMVEPAWSTSAVPSSTRSTLALMSDLISRAIWLLRCARLRTSLATTAKPRPCSPARAASTAAFSARMFVWKAMPSIRPMMSEIFLLLSLMPFMVVTTWPTTTVTLGRQSRRRTGQPIRLQGAVSIARQGDSQFLHGGRGLLKCAR